MALDLYAILKVSPAATRAEITRAYRVLLREHHPDSRTPDQASPISDRGIADTSATDHDTALQDVVDAYKVLHDPIQRAEYDKRRLPPSHPKTQPERRTTPRSRIPQFERPPIIAGPVSWQPPGQR